MTIYRVSGIFGHRGAQRLPVRPSDCLHTAEGTAQRLPARRPDAGDLIQLGAQGALPVALVVIGYGKAMGLLLNPANERKNRLDSGNGFIWPIYLRNANRLVIRRH